MKFLVSNDDGVQSEGLHALVDALRALGHVTVVAPDRERSAVGHSLTFFYPVRLQKISQDEQTVIYASDGTPTDCVLLGLYDLMADGRPDLVVSGINRGSNLGDDMHYSGTVSAAMEATIHGVPSFAISLAAFEDMHWHTAATVARQVAETVLRHGLPPKTFLNVNVPNVESSALQGFEATVQGESIYDQRMVKRTDPRGSEYYWISGAIPRGEGHPGTDFAAVLGNRVSITPVQLNLTNRHFLEELASWQWPGAQRRLAEPPYRTDGIW